MAVRSKKAFSIYLSRTVLSQVLWQLWCSLSSFSVIFFLKIFFKSIAYCNPIMHVRSSVVVVQNSGNDSWLFDGGFLLQYPNRIHITLVFLSYRLQYLLP